MDCQLRILFRLDFFSLRLRFRLHPTRHRLRFLSPEILFCIHHVSVSTKPGSYRDLINYFSILPYRARFAPDKANVFFLTVLRHPVERYLSEFLHHFSGWPSQNDGLTDKLWSSSRGLIESDFYCNGTAKEGTPSCRAYRYSATTREKQGPHTLVRGELLQQLGMEDRSASVLAKTQKYLEEAGLDSISQLSKEQRLLLKDRRTLRDFLYCPGNQASNRMTRMLAFMSCQSNSTAAFDQVSRSTEMLQSAMTSLDMIPYFSIDEYPTQSRQLFEWTFKVSFGDTVISISVPPVATAMDPLNQGKRLHRYEGSTSSLEPPLWSVWTLLHSP
eukprot:m.84825 g.84825  ORF g.84825 m.84825 type:complete len:330 (-) comp50852_c0_seq5:1367-2356(-)